MKLSLHLIILDCLFYAFEMYHCMVVKPPGDPGDSYIANSLHAGSLSTVAQLVER